MASSKDTADSTTLHGSDRLKLPASDDDSSTRVRVGEVVKDTYPRRITALSAAVAPPDELENERTVVDGPVGLYESLTGPGSVNPRVALDYDDIGSEPILTPTDPYDIGGFDPEIGETTLNNVPRVLAAEYDETSRTDAAPPPPAPPQPAPLPAPPRVGTVPSSRAITLPREVVAPDRALTTAEHEDTTGAEPNSRLSGEATRPRPITPPPPPGAAGRGKAPPAPPASSAAPAGPGRVVARSGVAQPGPSPAARNASPGPAKVVLSRSEAPPANAPPVKAPPPTKAPPAAQAPPAGKAADGAWRGEFRTGLHAPPEPAPDPAAISPEKLRKTPLVGGRYRVLERIGAGGMGKVFRVIHDQLGKTFALKIIRDNLAGQDKARDLFYREARLASSLSHPNITSVVDFGEDERFGTFMVMEFLQGEPLARLLKREKQLGLRQAMDIIRQMAEALHYIHGKGIVHCDIKTENILLTEAPGSKRRKLQVKLLDFGLARSTAGTRNTNSLTGTPHYVAPERIRGQEATPSADIYGLGILFYELLTGRVPWDGKVDAILSGHLNETPEPPSRFIEGGLDPAVEKLILHALAKTPEKRHKNIAAFRYELQAVTDMLGFGRRRGARRVVVERPVNQRDENARALFDLCQMPMALINRKGVILLANPAFAHFVTGIAVDLEGKEVKSTPLARVWTTYSSDLRRVCSGGGLRRTIEVEVGDGELRRLRLWLDPGLGDDQVIFGVHALDE